MDRNNLRVNIVLNSSGVNIFLKPMKGNYISYVFITKTRPCNVQIFSAVKIVKGGGLTLYEIYIGFCPRTDFYNIMHIACLVHGHFISNIDFLLTT